MREQERSDWVPPGLAHLFDVVLDATARVDGRLDPAEQQLFFDAGSAAAEAGVTLGRLIDVYLRGAGELWEQRFTGSTADDRTVELGRTLRVLFETAVGAMADGFEITQRRTIREEETARREVIGALLAPGTGPPGAVVRDSVAPGLTRAASFVVAVAVGDLPLVDGGPIHVRISRQLAQRYPQRAMISAVIDGRLVVVAGDTQPAELSIIARALTAEAHGRWRVGVSDPTASVDEIPTSFQQASEAAAVAERFGLGPTVEYSKILVQRLLTADAEVTDALTERVLAPLRGGRGEALVATLDAFFGCCGNMAETGRRLGIGTRTVAYRLDRIADLTGCSVRDPDGRLLLELALRSLPLAGGE